MTFLKRAGPPRAGPGRALTKKTPAATGVFGSSQKLSSVEDHTPRSDGTEQVGMICAFSPSRGEVGDRE